MKPLIGLLLTLSLLSCRLTDLNEARTPDTVPSEYPDWYVLKAPIDRPVTHVWGNIDKTLLLSTTFAVFRSTDRGQTWQVVHEQNPGLFGVVQYRDTLFTMGTLSTRQQNQSLQQPTFFSTDDGRTWQAYRSYNPGLDYNPRPGVTNEYLLVNPVNVTINTSYRIKRVFADGSDGPGAFETPGVVTNTGRRIDLPQLHQLQTLHVDSQQRLYIAGSDAVCSRLNDNQPFRFCNSENGRGVVYVSKRPLP